VRSYQEPRPIKDRNYIRIVIPIAISILALLSMVWLVQFFNANTAARLHISGYSDVDLTFTIQIATLLVSFVVILLTYVYDRQKLKEYFRFSFKSSTDWRFYGPLTAIGFTMGTAMMMSFSVAREHGLIDNTFLRLLAFVLLFSATNAWSEEIISRLVIVAGLSEKLHPSLICIISAVIFGMGHIFGTPSGLFGVVASGTLGWFLARSVVETRSIAWALLIHFLQDVVIFGSGAMILAAQH